MSPQEPPQPPGRAITQLSEGEREQAMARFAVLRPHLEDGSALAQAARAAGVALRTAERWLSRYRSAGLNGLARMARADRGRPRLAEELVQLIEGLALSKPRPSVTAIHRRIAPIARERQLKTPAYSSVHAIVSALDPALVTLAHQGHAAYRDQFELIYRHRAERPNATWQADHTQLDILVLDANGQPKRPWLTTVIDDYSRIVAGYTVFLGAPSALQTCLALRQAIWRKEDPAWPACGIPEVLYVDHGCDFTSRHLEQVAADLKIQLVHSAVARPQGRGKVERLFGTLNTELLCDLPGYLVEGKPAKAPKLSLSALDAAIGAHIIGTYNVQKHQEIDAIPRVAWLGHGWVPRIPQSLEALDLLLIEVATARIIRRDGIHFEGLRYLDATLAAYVGESVTVRYDPRDLAEIRVFHHDHFLCRAINQQHSDQTLSLKDIQTARVARRRALRGQITERVRGMGDFWGSGNAVPSALPAAPPSRARGAQTGTAALLGRYVMGAVAKDTIGRRAGAFIATKEHRRFVEFATAVRENRYIGLCYGAAGVGKTLSARQYANWPEVESLLYDWGLRERSTGKMLAAMNRSRTLFYTPAVGISARVLNRDIHRLLACSTACIRPHNDRAKLECSFNHMEMVIVDEVERLSTPALEFLRDLFDRSNIGLILIGMTGIDKRLARYPRLYSRVGFAHHYRPLQGNEFTFVLARHWRELGLCLDGADFADAQAIAAVARITGGNFRLIHRLFVQIERLMDINHLTAITDDVVNAARRMLVIGTAN